MVGHNDLPFWNLFEQLLTLHLKVQIFFIRDGPAETINIRGISSDVM
jgi:hypothetical protein